MIKSIKKRDKSDRTRKYGPLIKTKDSTLINTTKLSKKACFKKIKAIMDRETNKLMEVYKDISNDQNLQFKKLLVDNFSKTKIEEGKLLTGKITKISEKHVYLLIDGMKSEALIDVNEVKLVFGNKDVKENDKLEVYLEKIEDKNGEVIVSASRAQKIRGWYVLEKAYEENKNVKGKIVSKCKGGVIVEHLDTKSLMFCPGSQMNSKPLKSFDHLFGVEQDFKIIKLDKFRGNACVSRREVISSFKREDKAKIIEKYNVGDIIKNAIVKGYSSFGCFFEVNNEIDVLVHLQEISYSRISHRMKYLRLVKNMI